MELKDGSSDAKDIIDSWKRMRKKPKGTKWSMIQFLR